MYLDWEQRDTYVIDIETDDLDATKIHVMCWKNVKTGETGACIGHDQIVRWFEGTEGGCYVGHNVLKFDGPVLNRLSDTRLGVSNCIDTLVLSQLYSPSIIGGHSLGAWGERLGRAKIEFNDFSKLTPEMITYCHMDVEITCELFKKLTKVLKKIGFSERSIWIQHRLTVIIERQRKNGFKFDGPRALDLYRMLRSREEELQDEIRRVFPPVQRLVRDSLVYTKTGRNTAIYERDCGRYLVDLYDGGQSYKAYEDIEFSIGSPKQRTEKLLELGWEPEEFTPTGNPKPFDKGQLSPSLERFLEGNDIPEVHLIAKWMAINGRANMINTWLNEWNEDDGCIHGSLFVANTLRFRHQKPNTANIPAVRTSKDTGQPVLGEAGYYTYEARDLWTARPNRVLVGTDAAGLELRMLAHYLNRPEFTKQVIEGDPHQFNADTVGITRAVAKTLLYAIMYGAAAPKIAKTLGVPVREGARIRTMFLERLGLKELIEECQKEQANGRIELIDGSQVICPSPHSSLNYKLQGGGARVMGLSTVLADREVRRNGWDVLKVGDIHDEDQSDSAIWCAEDFGKMRVQSIADAGEEFNMNLPLDGTYKLGTSWAKTH